MDSRFNHALTQDWVCAQCGCLLVEICDEGKLTVVCSHDRSHEGKIRRSTVELRRQQERLEGIELGMAYPELLSPNMPDSVRKDMEDLFGSIKEAEDREAALPVQWGCRGCSKMWK